MGGRGGGDVVRNSDHGGEVRWGGGGSRGGDREFSRYHRDDDDDYCRRGRLMEVKLWLEKKKQESNMSGSENNLKHNNLSHFETKKNYHW